MTDNSGRACVSVPCQSPFFQCILDVPHRTNFGLADHLHDLRIQYISTNQLLEDFLNSVVSQDEFEIAAQNLVESLYPTTQNMDYECSMEIVVEDRPEQPVSN